MSPAVPSAQTGVAVPVVSIRMLLALPPNPTEIQIISCTYLPKRALGLDLDPAPTASGAPSLI